MEKNWMEKIKLETTSTSLHIMAMLFMLCDHLWGTVVLGNDWLTCVGRLAFPIFALLSEIPFNLMMGSRLFYPIHQNVLWTFLIAIGLMHLNEKAKKNGKAWVRIVTGAGTVILAYILGLLTMVDYYHAGVLTVLVFYFFRGRKWWQFVGQFVLLVYINQELLSGFAYEINWCGDTVFFLRQNFALLALIPIWLYRGKQGMHNKKLQYTYYAFYPVHMLVLALIK